MLLPLIGAGLGGYEAYRRSGGDIGAAALGAGAGALAPGALRMAGTALGGLGAGALSKTALGGLLQKQAAQTGTSLLTQIPTAAGAAAAGLGTFLGAPALAGQLASGIAPAAKTVASGTAGLMAGNQPNAPQYDPNAVPGGLGPFGPQSPYGTPLDMVNPAGYANARSILFNKEINDQVAAMRKLNPEIFAAAEARSKNELQRQLAAAGIRQNIATTANMLERSQQAAQQMGVNAASQAGSALTSQYQYS